MLHVQFFRNRSNNMLTSRFSARIGALGLSCTRLNVAIVMCCELLFVYHLAWPYDHLENIKTSTLIFQLKYHVGIKHLSDLVTTNVWLKTSPPKKLLIVSILYSTLSNFLLEMPNLEGLKTKKSRRIVNQQQASEKQLRVKSFFLGENQLLHFSV